MFFSWKKRGGIFFRGEGITRNVSLRGAFVLTPICPPVDASVEIEIALPRPQPAPSLVIVGKLRVQRVEGSPTKKRGRGFSAAGSGFVVQTSSPQRPAILKLESPSKEESTKAVID